MAARCSAIKASGERCRGIARTGSQWCPAHDPAREEDRRIAGARGGPASRELAAVKRRVLAYVDRVLDPDDEAFGKGEASAVAQLLHVYLRALEIGRHVRETEELAGKLEEMERRLTEAETADASEVRSY